jgi:dTDP-glucose 4,6-dehydratase
MKIETELGWHPRFSSDIGLVTTVDWYLANREWWGSLRGGQSTVRSDKAMKIWTRTP